MSDARHDLADVVRSPEPCPTGLPRLLPSTFDGQPPTLARHVASHGRLPPASSRCGAELIADIEESGLTGRGGAAFPTARKLAAVAAARGSAVVVVNGTEGEPASAKDKVLMATEPHLVLDGAVVAARVAGAREVIVAANPAVVGTIDEAIAARRALGLDDVLVRVVPAAHGFVAGEASAVVNWLAGGPPIPTATPPRLAQRGMHGLPTLVQNAETLAHVALIARYGARWFRELGTAAEPGSMLVTVIGAVREPGVREIEIGTPVTDVLARAGGPGRPLSRAADRRILRHLGAVAGGGAAALLRCRAGGRPSGACRWPGSGAACRCVRAGRDGARRSVPGCRVGGPVRPVRLWPGRHRP